MPSQLNVSFKTGLDSFAIMIGRARALQEGLQMLSQDLVQRMLFWLTATVGARLGMKTIARHGAGRAATCGPDGDGWASGVGIGMPLRSSQCIRWFLFKCAR